MIDKSIDARRIGILSGKPRRTDNTCGLEALKAMAEVKLNSAVRFIVPRNAAITNVPMFSMRKSRNMMKKMSVSASVNVALMPFLMNRAKRNDRGEVSE